MEKTETVAGMDNQLFGESAVKDCMNQEMLRQYKKQLHHESSDGYVIPRASCSHRTLFPPHCQPKEGSGISPGYCGQTLSISGANRSMASSAGCGMLITNDGYTSQYFPHSSNYYKEPSKLVACDGKSMYSLDYLNQLYGSIVSPEQFSSVTASSDAQWYSSKDLFEAGENHAVASFPDLTPGDNVHLDKYYTFSSSQISPFIQEDAKALSSVTFDNPELSHKQISQYWLQPPQSRQFHIRSCPPAHFDNSLEAQLCWLGLEKQKFSKEVPLERLPKLSQLPLEQPHSVQQQGFHNAQASIPTDPVRFEHNILVSYLNHKAKLVDTGRSLQEFVLYLHSTLCNVQTCECQKYSMLISHFNACHNTACNLCQPVRQLYLAKRISSGLRSREPKEYVSRDLHPRDYMQPTSKRMKIEHTVQHDDWSLSVVAFPHLQKRIGGLVDEEDNSKKINKDFISFKEPQMLAATWNDTPGNGGSNSPKVCFRNPDEHIDLKPSPEDSIYSASWKEVPCSMSKFGKSLHTYCDAFDDEKLGNDYATSPPETSITKSDVTFSYLQSLSPDCISVLPEASPVDEGESIRPMTQAQHDRRNANYDLASSDYHCGRKLEDLKVSGVSLTDFFTAEQLKVHLCSLNPSFNLNAGKEMSGTMPAPTVGTNTCQLCVKDALTFIAPPLYCTCCGNRIKHKSSYYWTHDRTEAQCFFCNICFKNSRRGKISFRGVSFSKAKLNKDKNTEEPFEPWVQCEKCEQWQHQICALYNSERDFKGKVKYICPFCRLAEIEANVHVSIAPAFGARDLPRTKLSDHIEQKLFKSLEQERYERAVSGKHPEEVPGASDLTVRVVLAVNKQLKVNQQFLDVLHNETYPTEFPYKSKVILLFQKIDGVDVCLFAMYVQEFGAECGNPNKRSVYISYLDSVKFFRPETKTLTDVAFRTFVYHEILIGYLDYCKRLGFATCYIWACPSLRGEDYILNCHPENQKMPSSKKLVQWYKKMLAKAEEENVVVGSTNFYDHFFVPSEESSCKITAARLPYFDGDYWSRAIVDKEQTIGKDSGENSERQLKFQRTKRALRATRHSEIPVDKRKDILFMQKLEQEILPVKEEFFVVHLHFTCKNCHEAILSGVRWSCNQCSKFHLCDRCLKLEKFPTGLESHTNIHGDKHQLYEIPMDDATDGTEDNDELSDRNIFDDRDSFLMFCQKNNYQFDTLRRAKHSSMMILHHLSTSKATTTKRICCICNQDFMVGWHCEICSPFHVCNMCYQKKGDGCHVHKLVKLLMEVDSKEKHGQIQKLGALEVLDLLNHANQCHSTTENPCLYPNCRHLKSLFLHNRDCQLRLRGGCIKCRKIWSFLQFHSKHCTNFNCNMPRCRELKNHKTTTATTAQRGATNNGQ